MLRMAYFVVVVFGRSCPVAMVSQALLCKQDFLLLLFWSSCGDGLSGTGLLWGCFSLGCCPVGCLLVGVVFCGMVFLRGRLQSVVSCKDSLLCGLSSGGDPFEGGGGP